MAAVGKDMKRPYKRHGYYSKAVPEATRKAFLCWRGMLARCNNPKGSDFKNYGGRGIKVCSRWRTFESFFADMGENPPGLSLERKDNNKGYSKKNCCWATLAEQSKNRRIQKNNLYGVSGIYKDRKTGRYQARFFCNNKENYLGTFGSLVEAVAERKRAEVMYGYKRLDR